MIGRLAGPAPRGAMRERLATARDITPEERTEFAKRWNGIVGL
ncbi:hypothetical protein [Streptomyces sp. NPDC001970]